MEPLDGDRSVQLLIVGAPNLGAAANGEALDEPVSVEDQLLVHACPLGGRCVPLQVLGRFRGTGPALAP